jgi:hypothetical protein
MAKDHGPSIKNDKQYGGLRKKGRASNEPHSSLTAWCGPPWLILG